MTTRIAINGFGRIGRLVFRQLMEASDSGGSDLEVVALNDVAPLDNLAYLLRHDSVHANPRAEIRANEDRLRWNDREVRYTTVKDPSELPWDEAEVDICIESTGLFTHRDGASKHLEAGADHVVISAPAKGGVQTVCLGVNEEEFDPSEDHIVSNASCTTNALAPVAKVLDDQFGIEHGALTTVHAYTSSQNIVDGPKKKWRRGRAAAASIVPTSTGAAVATTEVLPQLEGKMDGMAMRVPVPDGSVIDFVATTEQSVSVDDVNDAFRGAASSSEMKGVLGVSEEELVSSDIIGCNYSSFVDAASTMCFGDNMVKVIAWYDNEWGYARRVADLAGYIADNS